MLTFPLKLDGASRRGLSERAKSRHCEPGRLANVARLCWWSAIKSSMRLLHRIEIEGLENVPESGPFVLVSNHASHLDALVLGSALPLRDRDRMFPLAAGDVFFEKPVVAAFATTVLNALPVQRKNCGAHALRDLRCRLVETGSIYILFPEGGRTRDGAMTPFKPGVGMLVAGTEIPIVPCHVSGTFQSLPAGSFLPRPTRIELRIGSPRTFGEVPNRRTGWEEIAAALEQDVRALEPAPRQQPCATDLLTTESLT